MRQNILIDPKLALISIIFLWAVFLPFKALAATYYVDSANGNDSYTITQAQNQSTPWKTIDKVNKSTFQPGDNILFKRGQVWREQLTVPSSGTSGNPITFGAYGSGANPKIYRTDTFTAWWEHSLMANGGMEYFTPGDSGDQWSKQNEGSGTSFAQDTLIKNTGNASAKLFPLATDRLLAPQVMQPSLNMQPFRPIQIITSGFLEGWVYQEITPYCLA